MAIFNRRDESNSAIPDDLKPYYQGGGSAWQRWVGPVLRGLLLLAVLGLVVWGGIWGVSKLVNRGGDAGKSGGTASTSQNKNDKSSDTKSSDDTSADGQGTSSNSTTNDSGNSGTSNGSSTPAPQPVPAPAPSPSTSDTSNTAANGDQLANSGPREVLIAFFGAVVLGTFGFYFAAAYRANAGRS